MKPTFLYIAVAFFLVACSERSDVEETVRARLKDPASAQFKDFVVSDSSNFACIVWNARNSMGGYGDWDIAELKRENSQWQITKMRGSVENCTAEGLKSKESTAQFWEDIKDVNKSNQPS